MQLINLLEQLSGAQLFMIVYVGFVLHSVVLAYLLTRLEESWSQILYIGALLVWCGQLGYWKVSTLRLRKVGE